MKLVRINGRLLAKQIRIFGSLGYYDAKVILPVAYILQNELYYSYSIGEVITDSFGQYYTTIEEFVKKVCRKANCNNGNMNNLKEHVFISEADLFVDPIMKIVRKDSDVLIYYQDKNILFRDSSTNKMIAFELDIVGNNLSTLYKNIDNSKYIDIISAFLVFIAKDYELNKNSMDIRLLNDKCVQDTEQFMSVIFKEIVQLV